MKAVSRITVTLSILYAIYAYSLLNVTGCANSSAANQAVDVTGQGITLYMSEEPPDLNSLTTTDSVSIGILAHVEEGLLSHDENNELAPGVAEKWEMQNNGTTWLFSLRDNALWNDGTPVRAQDFVFSWRKAVDPKTASEYAYMLYWVKNGAAINVGKQSPETLGVRAVNDYQLEITLERPCPFFLQLTVFPTLLPIQQAFFDKIGKYATDADKMLYNGPFILTQWKHDASMRLEKNPRYWNQKAVHLNYISYAYFTKDPKTAFDLFRNDKVALVGLNRDTITIAPREGMRIRSFSNGAMSYLDINRRSGRPTANLNMRRALQAAMDPAEFVERIIAMPDIVPAYSFFPSWIKGEAKNFLAEHPPQKPVYGETIAKDYLQKAMKELQLTQLPNLTLLTNDSPDSKRDAEYMQEHFKLMLGLDLRIDIQTFKERLNKMNKGEFDLVMAGWGPDYDDMFTFADLFKSNGGNNYSAYKSELYDEQVRIIESTIEQPIRVAALTRLQQLITDDVVVIPLYESIGHYVQHPQLRDVKRSPFPIATLKYAKVVAEK